MNRFDTASADPTVTHVIADGTSATPTVVAAVAAVENRRPTDLPPLTETVDTDAFNELVGSAADLRVAFDYCGYRVVVRSGTVELY